MYVGDVQLSSNVDILFTTVSQGVPFTLAGSPVISAYPDNSLTQLTAGITLNVDWDGVTGLNHIRVAATTGNGYAAGSDYSLIITTGTVNGLSAVGYTVGSFSIENRVLNWAKISSPTTTVGLTGTTISTSQVIASVSGAVGSVTATVAANLTQILGTVLTETAGFLAAGFKKFFNVSLTPSATMDHGILVDTATSVTNRVTANTDQIEGVDATDQIRDSILSDATRFPGADINASIGSRAVAGDAMTLTAGERNSVADALLDRADAVETGITPRQSLRLFKAVLAGVAVESPAGTYTIKRADGTTTAVTVVHDTTGNRTSITIGTL